MTGLSGILASKKFTAALMAVIGAVGMALTGQITWKEAGAASLAGAIAAILGQGAADVGSTKTRLKIEASKKELEVATEGLSPADKAAALRDAAGE